jgi:8-oxo-dGTP diphosphatase
VKTVVAAVIERERRVLIGQRRGDDSHPLKWEFPGGKVEENETPEAGLVRELREELDVEAKVDGEITRYTYEYPGRPALLLIFFRVKEWDREPQAIVFEKIEWVERERLPGYDFLEGDVEFVKSLKDS